MARETARTLADEILFCLRNLTTPHESEAYTTFPVAIALARSINYGTVARVTPEGKRHLIAARDALQIWQKRQYDFTPSAAGNYALKGEWPTALPLHDGHPPVWPNYIDAR